jgi:hypothetical protein
MEGLPPRGQPFALGHALFGSRLNASQTRLADQTKAAAKKAKSRERMWYYCRGGLDQALVGAVTHPLDFNWDVNGWVSRTRSTHPTRAARGLIERLELDDRGAVVVADPERRRRGRIVDEDPAHIGLLRQQILGDLAGLGIEPLDQIIEH